jgi:hypothetical protein
MLLKPRKFSPRKRKPRPTLCKTCQREINVDNSCNATLSTGLCRACYNTQLRQKYAAKKAALTANGGF